MQLLTPEIGLIAWLLLNVISLILVVWAVVVLAKINFPDFKSKIFWLFIVVFIPTIGPLIFLTIGKKKLKHSAK